MAVFDDDWASFTSGLQSSVNIGDASILDPAAGSFGAAGSQPGNNVKLDAIESPYLETDGAIPSSDSGHN